jgi:DNA-binding response OmpR family regulator
VLLHDRDDALASGCDDFLPKPFLESDLLSRLRDALQLEWIHAAPVPPDTFAHTHNANHAPTPPASPRRLSPTDVTALLALARRGEIVPLRQRLAAARGDPLADELGALAESYRMDRIRERLEQHVATAGA